MAKTFTVVSADTNSRVVFETEATTVGQLLDEFDAHNINYTDKTIFEGLTKSEFNPNNREGILPHDVEYKGQITNNLVFMLTAAKKKIASGMDRKEAYAYIRDNGLGAEVSTMFHKNYTNVPTADLVSFVNGKMAAHVAITVEVSAPAEENLAEETIIVFVIDSIKKGIVTLDALMSSLQAEGIVEMSAPQEVAQEEAPAAAAPKCPWGEDDLNGMF